MSLDNIAEEETIALLRALAVKEGDVVAVYENKDLDSGFDCGRHVFLITGPTRTFKEPPPHAPDGNFGFGWRCLLIGTLNLATNTLAPSGKMAEGKPEGEH